MSCPRIVVAGTQSGVGKTSLALGLVAALRRRGLRVQTFKVGPDFLDPTHLTRAAGRPCYNLDCWMSSADYVRRLVARASRDADIAVIEGVMGLFDGSDAESSEGSTAQIAQVIGAPVLLVVQTRGMARSMAAMVKGYVEFEPGLRIAGVVANQVGSDRHARWLADSLASAAMPPLVGAVPRDAFPRLASRHLGLVSADERTLPGETLDRLADAVEQHVDLGKIRELASQADNLSPGEPEDVAPVSRATRVGIAFDEAFHFYYQDFFDELEARGCELVRFSPLADAHLPPGLDILYLGGGYPEERAEILSANEGMSRSIREYIDRGGAVYAECGGLMYLSQGLETRDGKRHAMLGVIPSWTRMLERRKALGYVEVLLEDDSLVGRKGDCLRGHEFHYSELTGDPSATPGWRAVYTVSRRRSSETTLEGYRNGPALASYLHLHLASRPAAIAQFLKCAQSWKTPNPQTAGKETGRT